MSAALLACCALVLLASAFGHLRGYGAFARGIAAHGVLPTRLHRAVATAVPAVEIVLGVAAAAGAGIGNLPLASAAALGCTLLFGLMAAYVHRARRTAPTGTPCACGIGEAPLGLWVTARAVTLAVAAAIAAVSAAWALGAGAPAWGFTGRPTHETLVMGCAALALAIGIGLLPAARSAPGTLTLTPRMGRR